MKKRGYLQISFSWLFAIIIGVFILSFAIYFSTKIIKTEQTIQDAKTGKDIGILLNPLETGFEEDKINQLNFPVETRIYNKCNTKKNFGRQIIQVSQKSFNKWSDTNIDVGFSNKYIFSDNFVEGEKFYIFSKIFEFPFKVSDLMFITSSKKTYCFKDAPGDISQEISNLNQKNLITNNCSEEDIKICFSGNCEIKVDLYNKQVIKDNEIMNFEGDALMYAAIFSEKKIYECQLKRLMKRVDNLALLYNDKASIVRKEGCESDLDLIILSNNANNFLDSTNLDSINNLVETIKYENDIANCRLW